MRPRKSTFRTRGHGDVARVLRRRGRRARSRERPPRVRANRRCRYLTTVCARLHRLDRASHVARGLDRALNGLAETRGESSRARVPPRGKTTRTSRSNARRRRSSARSVEGFFNRRFRAVALGRRATTRERDSSPSRAVPVGAKRARGADRAGAMQWGHSVGKRDFSAADRARERDRSFASDRSRAIARA